MKRIWCSRVLLVVATVWLATMFEQSVAAQQVEAAPAVAVETGVQELPDGVVDIGAKKIEWKATADAKFVTIEALQADDATKKIAQAMVAADPTIKGFRFDPKDRLLCVALPNVTVKKAFAEYASDCSTNTQSTLTAVAEIRKSGEAALIAMTRVRHPKIPETWQAVVTEVAKAENHIKLDVTLKEGAKTPAITSVSLR